MNKIVVVAVVSLIGLVGCGKSEANAETQKTSSTRKKNSPTSADFRSKGLSSSAEVDPGKIAYDSMVFVFTAGGWVLMKAGEAAANGFRAWAKSGAISGESVPHQMKCYDAAGWKKAPQVPAFVNPKIYPDWVSCSAESKILTTNPKIARERLGINIHKAYYQCPCKPAGL